MSTTLCYCPGCGEILEGSEPCECVFVARGTIDAQGVLHTAKRVPVAGDKPAEFPRGEFDDGQQLREPATLPEPDRWDWLTERGGDPEDWEPVHDQAPLLAPFGPKRQ